MTVRRESLIFLIAAFFFTFLALQAVPWWMLLPFVLMIGSVIGVALDTERPDKPVRYRPGEKPVPPDEKTPDWWWD